MLAREEYVEQAYFFRVLLERLLDRVPIQDLFRSLRDEVLSTTKLPLAIGFMLDELKHTGTFSAAMERLDHYFRPFQTFLIQSAEREGGRFDLRVAIDLLRAEAEYLSREPLPQGLFLFQFESLCRNRLAYDPGLGAIARDPMYDGAWHDWILTVRRQIGLVELADLIYVRSDYYVQRARQQGEEERVAEHRTFFGEKEGRIALANRRKDPLLLFNALQRHLNYPAVPRPQPADEAQQLVPQLARRVERLEMRLKLMEEEQSNGIDLTKYYLGPGGSSPPPPPPRSDRTQ
ncbi:MAG: hypothetical protein U0795_13470 [Pirellulales bacterium]